MDGDEVEVDLDVQMGNRAGSSSHRCPEARRRGEIVRILSRAHMTLIGHYERNGTLGVVSPFDERISYDVFTQADETPDVQTGAVVSVRITSYPSRYESAQGVIEKVLHQRGGDGSDIETIALAHGIDGHFSSAALVQAGAVALDVDAALSEPLRRDLRNRNVFTIDPIDAMDFDDALSLEHVDGLFRLGVHIADVAAYVPWGTPIDLDARQKGVATYLVGKVLPMLPESLSNGVCSLSPRQDRLTVTVDLYIDPRTGKSVHFDIFPSVIRSSLRLDYTAVQHMFDGDVPWIEFPDEQRKGAATSCGTACMSARTVLEELDGIAFLRHAERLERGGIDFDFPETEVRLDKDRRPIELAVRPRTRATALVEEAMLLANETVARYLTDAESPMLYRVHGAPSSAALAALGDVLEEMGYVPDGLFDGDPHEIQRILQLAESRSEGFVIDPLVLRTMKRARYLERIEPHYGLAMDCYTHFTSPIRRYPDLVVHRLLRARLYRADKVASPTGVSVEVMAADLGTIAEHCSQMEREADVAAAESMRHAIVLVLARYIGEEFDGTIIDLNATTALVRLDNTAECRVTGFGMCDFLGIGEDTSRLARDGRADTGALCERSADIDLGGRSRHAPSPLRLGQRVRVRIDETCVQPPVVECSITAGNDVGVQ